MEMKDRSKNRGKNHRSATQKEGRASPLGKVPVPVLKNHGNIIPPTMIPIAVNLPREERPAEIRGAMIHALPQRNGVYPVAEPPFTAATVHANFPIEKEHPVEIRGATAHAKGIAHFARANPQAMVHATFPTGKEHLVKIRGATAHAKGIAHFAHVNP